MRENESLRESERDIIPDLRLRRGGEGIQAKLVRTPMAVVLTAALGAGNVGLNTAFSGRSPSLSLLYGIDGSSLFLFFFLLLLGLPATVTLSP
jgi:hypothetical protein